MSEPPRGECWECPLDRGRPVCDPKVSRRCPKNADPFAEPVTFSSGVQWAPDEYKPLSPEARAEYLRFSAKPEGKPKT